MTGKDKTDKLRRENESLKAELKATRDEMQRLADEVKQNRTVDGATLSPERRKSVDFISDQYDNLDEFRVRASQQISALTLKLDEMDRRCNEIGQAIEEILSYSYQYNIKIFGLPMTSERESSYSTAQLCVRLFSQWGSRIYQSMILILLTDYHPVSQIVQNQWCVNLLEDL